MTILPPESGEPRRPQGPRDPGDAWVEAPSGERYWGRFGAAGLLALDPELGVLLQHRVAWSHHGGTWALPGGARHEGESATDAAIREATEEAGVPDGSVRPRLLGVLDLGYWSYTTLVADVVVPFEPVISDPESLALAWVPVAEIDGYPLHPGFASSWAGLRRLLDVRPLVIVDAANVVGSVPDGWWRDRAGATARLIERIALLADAGVPAAALGLEAAHWFPEFVVVREGAARGASAERGAGTARGAGAGAAEAGGSLADGAERISDAVRAVDAPGAGDDEIVAQVVRATASGYRVTVVTSDRELSARSTAAGADVRSAGWLLNLLAE
ncbi:NUDIX hydrolase [Microbacterium sp. cx-55]|uniref:NUDIX domain-containing protein n=1 Tax=Microbacterium sp. cx-55 TaxID=2875948 RepID=UPI001CBE653A|nr:NUDIX hydrolase [Microbacterium sp. cx-55]MBZ4486784.1 NUDIX hydrolase [Microbacterium sp. cx-55]UGB36260.1 NUDIX hydrolase [Microbacterium sp. cx-55]